MQQTGGSQSENKSRLRREHPVKELSSCLRYAFSEAVGFPLASSRADVLALWPAEEPDKSPGCPMGFFSFCFVFN